MFCAAAPAVIAVGTALDSEQRKRRSPAAQTDKPYPCSQYPFRALTALAVIMLLLGSALYHIFQRSG